MANFVMRSFHSLLIGMTIVVALPCGGAEVADSLAGYLGPRPGKTYAYSIERPGNNDRLLVTVAGVAIDKNTLATCSPANSMEYPESLQKLGAQPILSKLLIRNHSMLSVRGRAESILLKAPLRPDEVTWENKYAAVLPDGKHQTTLLRCSIASVGIEKVFDVKRSVVTVRCEGNIDSTVIKVSTTYAEGLGPVEELNETFNLAMKPMETIRRKLTEVREGAEECATLVKSTR